MASLLLSKSPSNNSTSSSSSSTSSSSSSSSSSNSTLPCGPHKSLSVLSGHSGPISSLALCGSDFLLSASTSDDTVILWKYPFLSPSATLGTTHVKSLLALGNRLFSAHQDARIRVWNLSPPNPNPENLFNLVATLPTKTDRLSKILNQSNYVRTRRHHRKLWIQHADTISCLAADANRGFIYSASWDKTVKVWRVSDFKCLESISAHDDAVNTVVADSRQGLVYSGSADGKIKVWGRERDTHCLMGCLEGHKGVCWNAVIVCEPGEFVYGGGSDGRVMGWVQEKKNKVVGNNVWSLVCDIRAHESAAVLCLCAVGEFVCSGSADKSIGVWRREEDGKLSRVGCIRGHGGPVKCLQASEVGIKNGGGGGGFMLYSGGIDKSVRVWWVPKEYGEVKEEEEGQGMKKCVLLR